MPRPCPCTRLCRSSALNSNGTSSSADVLSLSVPGATSAEVAR